MIRGQAAALAVLGGRADQELRTLRWWKHRHVRKVAVFVVEIKPITDHKGVGYIKAAVIRLESDPLPALLAQQHDHSNRGCPQLVQMGHQVMERLPGVQNVVEEQDVAPAHIGDKLRLDMQNTRRGGRAPVAGRLNQADPQRNIELPNQVGEEDQAAGQDAHNRDRPIVKIPCNLPGQLADAFLNPVGRNEDVHGTMRS